MLKLQHIRHLAFTLFTVLFLAAGNYGHASSIAIHTNKKMALEETGLTNISNKPASKKPYNKYKTQAIINFPPPVIIDIDKDNFLHPVISSNNNETPITYTTSNPAVAGVNFSTGTLIRVYGPGTVVITAHQAESQNYLQAIPVSQTFIFRQINAITAPPIGDKLICAPDFQLNATSTSPRTLVYKCFPSHLASITPSGVVHLLAPGAGRIIISQPGTEMFEDVAPLDLYFVIKDVVTPEVNITSDKNSICAGSLVTFTAFPRNAGANPSYKWFVNSVQTGFNSSTFSVNNLVSTDEISCEITSSDECLLSRFSNLLRINVTPVTTPSITIQAQAGAACTGSPITFIATPQNAPGGADYQWRVNDLIVSTTFEPKYTFNGLNNGDKVSCVILANQVSQCATAATANSNEITVSLTFPETTQTQISASANSIREGAAVTFTASAQMPVAAYQWQINNVKYNNNTPQFTAYNLKDGDKVNCILTLANACADKVTTQTITMQVIDINNIDIPNAFTPNGDGINDTWLIPDLSLFENYTINVYDRNGSLLYQSKGYANAWDGTFNGKRLPPGTYYYLINNPASKNKRSGYVTIIK